MKIDVVIHNSNTTQLGYGMVKGYGKEPQESGEEHGEGWGWNELRREGEMEDI